MTSVSVACAGRHPPTEDLEVQQGLGYLKVDLWPAVLTLYGDFNAAGGGVADGTSDHDPSRLV